MTRKKNSAAVALGRLGGSAKTTKPKGLAALSPERRSAIASMGGSANRKKTKRKKIEKSLDNNKG